MNFESIKKATAGVMAFVLLASAISFSTVSAETIEGQEVVEAVEAVGTGGSNAIVVERLRQEGLARQAELEGQEAMQNFTQESQIAVSSTDSRYNTQELPEYTPDFKTIGDVKAEEALLEAVVTAQEIEIQVNSLASSIEATGFSTQFSDIDASEDNQSIVILDALNIVAGRENTQFKPNEIITRKEAIKISTLVSGNSTFPRKSSSAADVDSSDWSVPYIEAALENGIINLGKGAELEGETPLLAGEAMALYLISAGVCIEVKESSFPYFTEFKKEYSSDISIVSYATNLMEEDEITRADFAEISVQVLTALSLQADYAPAEQLTGFEYSASQTVSAVRDEVLKLLSQ